jgi:hypothetical protein
MEKYEDFFKSGHIVMGYLPSGKIQEFFKRWHDRAWRRTTQEMETRKEMRAQGRIQTEVGLRNALPWMVEGSKAHSKEAKARRRTQKEVGLGNALTWMVEGSKAHSKEVEKY